MIRRRWEGGLDAPKPRSYIGMKVPSAHLLLGGEHALLGMV